MLDIARIVCPIDFSDTSRHALEHATAIADWYESRITALHVIAPVFLPRAAPVLSDVATTPSPIAAQRAALEAQLRTWLEPAARAGRQVDILVTEGHPATRILEEAAACLADLIVMGTHGLTGFERFMLGSVAEKVLRKAIRPVMTVPPAAATTAKVPYRRLLCPVDFSDSSLAAFRFAVSLAKESAAHLTILHVFEWPPDTELLVERFDADEFRRVIEQDAIRRLDALTTDDIRAWCTPTTKVGYGKPYREILDIADNDATDLIVMGVSGRNPIDQMLFGSTTTQVVRRARCPVLTIRH